MIKTKVDFLSDFTLQLHVLFIRIVKSESEKFWYMEYKECERDRKVALYRDKEKQENTESLGHLCCGFSLLPPPFSFLSRLYLLFNPHTNFPFLIYYST